MSAPAARRRAATSWWSPPQEAQKVFYESEGARIARFDARDEGVTFLGYFLLADGVDAGLVFPVS